MNSSRKWALVSRISAASDVRGDKLLELMEQAGANNLQQITEEQAERYCKEHGIAMPGRSDTT